MINSEPVEGVRQVFLKALYHIFNIVPICIYCGIIRKITSGDSKNEAEEEGEKRLFCRSLIPRMKQLPKQAKAFFRLQVEQLMFKAEMNLQPQNATVCSYPGFNGLPFIPSTPQNFLQQGAFSPQFTQLQSYGESFHMPLNLHHRMGKKKQHMLKFNKFILRVFIKTFGYFSTTFAVCLFLIKISRYYKVITFSTRV